MTTTRLTITAEPVSSAEVKTLIPLDGSDHDTRIALLIPALRQQAEQITGRAFASGNFACTLDAFPDDGEAIELHFGPVSALVSVSYVDTAGATQTLAGTQLDSSSLPARLLPAYGSDWPATRAVPNAVTVTYTTGLGASSPAEVKHWIAARIRADIDGCAVPDYMDGLLDSLKVY